MTLIVYESNKLKTSQMSLHKIIDQKFRKFYT